MADQNVDTSGTNEFFQMGRSSMSAELGTGGKFDGLDVVATTLKNKQDVRVAEEKLIEKEKKKTRKIQGEKITNTIIEIGPQMKELDQESYKHTTEQARLLREEMNLAIDNEDQEAIADVNIRLNELKRKSVGDADNLKDLTEMYEDKLVSTDAMTSKDQDIHANFVSNPSKKVVYDEDNNLAYQWNTLGVDGQPIIKKNPITGENEMVIDQITGQFVPVYETEIHTLADLQAMIVPKDNVNGERVIDYVQKEKEKIAADPSYVPSNSSVKKTMEDIIPDDPKQLRDWLWGNPAGADGLDVHGYLTDLLNTNEVLTFESLGINFDNIEDTNGDDVIDGYDVLPEQKKMLIDGIMNVEDLEISRSVISDIYADISINNIMGIEYRENAAGDKIEGNKNYHPEKDNIIGNNTNMSEVAVKKRAAKLVQLKNLENPNFLELIGGSSPLEIAKLLGFKSLDDQIFNDETKQFESIRTYIPNATNKKAAVKGGSLDNI
mgnify:FL=1